MVFCIPCLLLVAYFGIASIFIPKYRLYIKEGWRCFLDKLRGKKCSISFDNRMRLALSMWFAERNMTSLARFFNDERNFNITLTIVAIVSTVVSVYFLILFVNYIFYPPCVDNVCRI